MLIRVWDGERSNGSIQVIIPLNIDTDRLDGVSYATFTVSLLPTFFPKRLILVTIPTLMADLIIHSVLVAIFEIREDIDFPIRRE